jgi:hypothetical protein
LRWEAIVYDSEEEEESGGGFGAAWLPLRAEPPVPEEGATLDLFDDNDPEEPGALHGAESRAEGDLFDDNGFGTSAVHAPGHRMRIGRRVCLHQIKPDGIRG